MKRYLALVLVMVMMFSSSLGSFAVNGKSPAGITIDPSLTKNATIKKLAAKITINEALKYDIPYQVLNEEELALTVAYVYAVYEKRGRGISLAQDVITDSYTMATLWSMYGWYTPPKDYIGWQYRVGKSDYKATCQKRGWKNVNDIGQMMWASLEKHYSTYNQNGLGNHPIVKGKDVGIAHKKDADGGWQDLNYELMQYSIEAINLTNSKMDNSLEINFDNVEAFKAYLGFLIFSDIMILNGLATAEEVRSEYPRITSLASTFYEAERSNEFISDYYAGKDLSKYGEYGYIQNIQEPEPFDEGAVIPKPYDPKADPKSPMYDSIYAETGYDYTLEPGYKPPTPPVEEPVQTETAEEHNKKVIITDDEDIIGDLWY